MKLFSSITFTTGLAVFSMLFGAGNLIYPLLSGATSGDHHLLGIIAFCLTAVCLPIIGLMGIILFDGDYEQFFYRLGKVPGDFLIFLSLMLLGPLLVLPRIITLSHTMLAPFMPALTEISPINSFIFCIIFLSITFLATYRENKIVDILGKFISPALLVALAVIIIKGLLMPGHLLPSSKIEFDIIKENLVRGYETLDLLSSLYFAAMIFHILKQKVNPETSNQPRALAWIALKAGLLGASLLGIVYVGMSYLGAYHGYGLENTKAELFREIAFRVLGSHGAFIIATAVIMACLSTAIALSAIVAEYLQTKFFKNKVSYTLALIITLLACIPLSIGGLDQILAITAGPLLYIIYPVFIALTFCNIAYKLFGFTPIKVPVLITLIFAIISYYFI